MNWHELINDLPDVSGILLAAFGASIIFAPEPIKALDSKPKTRWTVAALLFAVGLAGMASSHVQRQDGDMAQKQATEQIRKAESAAIAANTAATRANEAASTAQKETEAAMQEARRAQESLAKLINKRSKETTTALVQLNTATETSVKGIPRPRKIPQEMKGKLIAELSTHTGVVTINCVGCDGESRQFAADWYEILSQSGWTVTSGVNVIYTPDTFEGVRITVKGEPVTSTERFTILASHPAAALGRALYAVTNNVIGQRQETLAENAAILDIGILPRPKN